MTVWRRVGYRQMKVVMFEGAFASKPAPTFEMHSNVGAGLPANEGRNDLPAISEQNQSSSAFTDLGDSRKLRRLRLTLLRWLTRLGPRAMATPIANTSITTR